LRRKTKRGRILYPSVSDSPRVARLSLTGALLWDYLLVHSDDQGRIAGDASALRERLVPFRGDVTTADVETALEEMARERLILRYTVYRRPLVQIVDWWKWQGRLGCKHPSVHPAPEGWRDRVTARQEDLGRYIMRMGYGMAVFCPACGHTVAPLAHGRGWTCPECDVELLGWRAPRPKVGGTQTRVTGKTRALVLAALGRGPLTKPQLAEATGRAVGTVGNMLTLLCRSKEVIRIRRKRPWVYRLAAGRVRL